MEGADPKKQMCKVNGIKLRHVMLTCSTDCEIPLEVIISKSMNIMFTGNQTSYLTHYSNMIMHGELNIRRP